MASFTISLNTRPCLRAKSHTAFQYKVFCPGHIELNLHDALSIAKTPGFLQQTTAQIIGSHGEHLPLTIQIPVDIAVLMRQLQDPSARLYIGKKLYGDVLHIARLTPAEIVIEQNVKFIAFPQNHLLSTAANLRDAHTAFTHGQPDESVRMLIEGDFNDVLNLLSRDDPEQVRQAFEQGKQEQILETLSPECKQDIVGQDLDYVCYAVSEFRRAKIIDEIRQSNLVDNIKIPLLHILSEKEAVYVSMFSFTSPIFAAALVAAWQRGAEVKILLDSREASQAYSQYENLNQYSRQPGFEVRIFSTTHQHLKNIICVGQRVVIMGSQNMSARAFTANLEDLAVISGDYPNFWRKADEFVEIFARQGEYVALPAEIAGRHFIQRAGLVGIRFLEKTPPPHEVEEIFHRFAELKPGDHQRLQQILKLTRGGKMELVYDPEKVFQPFIAEIRDPVLVHTLLPDFLRRIPQEFYWSAASVTEKYHPGTTTGLSGLVEHVMLVLEYGIMLCKFLGREELLDQFVVAAIAHDAFKNAHRREDGSIYWGQYNAEHGRIAAEELFKVFTMFDGGQRYLNILTTLYTAAAEHMSAYNRPVPTPLKSSDPLLKFVLVIADMLASRKYLFLGHRSAYQFTAEEILDVMLNNSFSIAGEGLDLLKKDGPIFAFIRNASASLGVPIENYEDIPKRAKKMLRVAESLCDIFGFIDVNDWNRHDILTAVLLYGLGLTEHSDLDDQKNKTRFSAFLRGLKKEYSAASSREGRIISYLAQADKQPAADDHPAVWIISAARFIMAHPNTWVMTDDEILRHLETAALPQTSWTTRRFSQESRQELAQQVFGLVKTKYIDEFLPWFEQELLVKLNYRKKKPLTAIERPVLLALVEKYQTFSPDYIYRHFYLPLDKNQRRKLIEALRRNDGKMAGYIMARPVPENKAPLGVFGLIAQTIMAANINDLEAQVLQPTRDAASFKRYDYLAGIKDAVREIVLRLGNTERITIYGDYDFDGQAGIYILLALRWIRAKVLSLSHSPEQAKQIAEETIDFYVPHRLREGYGLTEAAVERLYNRGTNLIITVDCGINDKAAIEKAKRLGMQVIVTDHHSSSGKESLPQDAIIINPKLCLAKEHPAYNIPGAMVAYKLFLAVAETMGISVGDHFVDILACAVLADKVAMEGESRAVVYHGMKRLRTHKGNRGITGILRNYKQPVSETLLAGAVAQLFDTLGRIGSASQGIDLLGQKDTRAARNIIAFMREAVRERQELENRTLDELRQGFTFNADNEFGIVLSGSWDRGLIGVIASNFAKEYGVPAMVVTTSGLSDYMGAEDPASGTLRSVAGVNPLAILIRCNEIYQQETGQPLFLSFGGHYVRSAGFSLEKNKIEELTAVYKRVCREFKPAERAKLTALGMFTEGEISIAELKQFISFLGPFGPGFEMPLFSVNAKVAGWQVFGKNHQHIKGVLAGGTRFIIYNGNKRWVKRVLMSSGGKVKMMARLGIDSVKEYGRTREDLVLLVEDLK